MSPSNWSYLWQTIIQQAVKIHPGNARKFAQFGDRISQQHTRMGLPWNLVREYINTVLSYTSAQLVDIGDDSPRHYQYANLEKV